MYDSIIIGAGMSGLAAGIRLAMFQRRVLILERHSKPGGLNSYYQRRGREYDVGLHAVTNYRPKGSRQGPLVRLLRQLRLGWDDLALAPQTGSSIVFPGARLDFGNDFDLLRSDVHRLFPRQTDGLERLVAHLSAYEELGRPATQASARQVAGQLLDEPLLVEMLLCPLLFYGGAREGDMDFGQFSVLFRSIYLEGLGRPRGGVRPILAALAEKFKAAGGELRFRSGVRRIVAQDGRASAVELDDGAELAARYVFSSAGWRETMRLCGQPEWVEERPAGRMAFIESISTLDRQPKDLGFDRTTVFFSDCDKLPYFRPEGLADARCGLVCSPDNFLYPKAESGAVGWDEVAGVRWDFANRANPRPKPHQNPGLLVPPYPKAESGQPKAESGELGPEEGAEGGTIRIAVPANYERWAALAPEDYLAEKARWYENMLAAADRFVPGMGPAVIDHDMFTPVTVRRFTGHDAGAIYGIPERQYDGATRLENLFLCGTDQGLVGIVGAIISGITMANRHVLGRDEGKG